MDARSSRDEDVERRRRWEEYDRELAAYHRNPDSGRGRSRSPVQNDGARKRRRSLSPWERGRYERTRYGDNRDYSVARDDYGRRGGTHHGPHGRDNRGRGAPPNPYDQDNPVQLKHFADWFRYMHPEEAAEDERLDRLEGASHHEAGSEAPKPRDGMKLKWEKYKREFATAQLTLMFEHHKKSPWFIEKYSPAEYYANLRKRVRKQGWRGKVAQFLVELEEGRHDPQVVSSDPELSKGRRERDGGGQSDDLVGKNGNQDEDSRFGADIEDENDNDHKNEEVKLSNSSSDPNEELKIMPEGNEILIRTLPPDIGRTKLEETCSSVSGFVHIALGDPSPRKHFYRAGWIKFTDGSDMERAVQELSEKKVDGFKLHINHTTRPFTTKPRVAPEVSNRPERILKDLEQIKMVVVLLEGEAVSLRKFRPDDIQSQSVVGNDMDVDQQNNPVVPPDNNNRPLPEGESESDSEPTESPSAAIEARAEKLTSEIPDQVFYEGIDPDIKKATILLDLYRAYLRVAYNTCYYCATTTDHVEELQRRCAKHIRKPLSSKAVEEIVGKGTTSQDENGIENNENTQPIQEFDENKEVRTKSSDKKLTDNRDWKRNDERWFDWLDSKLALTIRRSEIDPRTYSGKDYEEELSKACEAAIKQEDEGKYRCRQCNKLFKAVGFVEKHIANKHPEVVRQLDELTFYNNFALDPHRIQPSAHMPPGPVNGIGPPPQAYGLKGVSWPPANEFGVHNRGAAYGDQQLVFVGGPPPHTPFGFQPPYEHWGYGMQGYTAAYHDPMTPAPMGGRRLSDRLGGFVEHMESLPVKPMAGSGRRAPPADAREDPRASGGRKVSYHDIDKAAVGDDANVELSY